MSGSSASAGVGVGGMLSGSSGGPCGACKFLRRKCMDDCIFAPYFDSDQGVEHFTAVHKVFGASNVSKILNQSPPHKRLDAAITLCYEAKARLRDPVYGCVTDIFALQQRVCVWTQWILCVLFMSLCLIIAIWWSTNIELVLWNVHFDMILFWFRFWFCFCFLPRKGVGLHL